MNALKGPEGWKLRLSVSSAPCGSRSQRHNSMTAQQGGESAAKQDGPGDPVKELGFALTQQDAIAQVCAGGGK